MSADSPTLGVLIRNLRSRQGWTLKEMSEKSGIPVSTLSKVEHDRLTLTYDKLYQLSQRLGMRMSELFAEAGEPASANITARRSLSDRSNAIRVSTPNYDYHYLCAELRHKRMIPVIATVRADSAKKFGDLVQHTGEEFTFVLKGQVVLNTQFYDPVVLKEGQSVYFDSSMGHAYLTADGCMEAEVLTVMSSADGEEFSSLVALHSSHHDATTGSGQTTLPAASKNNRTKPTKR